MINQVRISRGLISMELPTLFLVFSYCFRDMFVMIYLHANIFEFDVLQIEFTYSVLKKFE